MDESFKLDLEPPVKKTWLPSLEELPTGTYNFKIIAAYPHVTRTEKKTFKFELLAQDSDSPIYGKIVHKLNWLNNPIGKNILMTELKAIGVEVNTWADPVSGIITGDELALKLATVGNEILGKVVVASKTQRSNANGADWHELRISGLSTEQSLDDLPF